MAGADDRGLDQALVRLEQLIEALNTNPGAAARESARELVSLVLDLHGIGLARLMAIVSNTEGGAAVVARVVEDEQVRALLLLHGLHPDDFDTRVRRAVDRLRPHLGVQGLRLSVVEIARGTVRLRIDRSYGGAIQVSALLTLRAEIEDAVAEAAPDAEAILIDGLDHLYTAPAVRAAK
jgi:hypothetical protein